MADYSIKLGINFDDSELKNVKKQLTNLTDNTHRIRIDIDNSRLLKQIDHAKRELKELNSTNGKQPSLDINTKSLEKSLSRVADVIDEVRKSLGTLDDRSGMKDILSSINQMTAALGKAENESDSLVKSLSALSKKDFSVNFDFKMGKSASQISSEQGDIKRDAISQLKQQAKALEDYLDQYYKVAQKQEGVVKLTQGTNLFSSFWEMSPNIGNTKVSLKQQVDTYKQYIDLIQEAAKIKGIDLSSVTSGFSKTTNDIVEETKNTANGIDEVKQAFKGLFGGNIDSEKLSTQLDSIVTDLGEIKTTIQGLSSGVSLEGLTQSFDRLSETLEQLMTNAKLVQDVLGTKSVDSGMSNQAKAAQETAKAYQEVANEAKKLDNVSIDISNGNIDDLKNALRNLKVDDTSIENVTKELSEMNIVAKSVSGTLKNGNLVKWDIKGVQTTVDGLERVVTITKTLGQEGWNSSTKYSQSLDKIAAAAKNIRAKLENTGFDGFKAEVQRAHTEADKLKKSSDELKTALKQLDVSMDEINSADQANDTKRLVAANEEYEKALRQVYSQLKLNQELEKNAYNAERLNKAKQSLSFEMDSWLKNNTTAAKHFGDRVRELQAQIESCDRTDLNNLEAEFKNIRKEANNTLKSTQSFGDKIKKQWSQYSQYLSVASLFMYAEMALKDMFEQVVAIDTAMTELKKVTDETDASYNRFLSNAAKRSKELGTTIDGLVASTADFARLGYGFEDSQGLAEVANIYAVVGDEINGVEGATESLISTMAAFKDEMNGMSNSDFAMSIIDKMNEVGKLIA